ncbi:Hypothetical protein NGAL_HAMBI2605_66220 [Neorhizobium galegae bv. orientalis]|nr:Hypothetical protein NGAL_HAMBI2605_66220 [Neorhizobium galegae bv. orientalis]
MQYTAVISLQVGKLATSKKHDHFSVDGTRVKAWASVKSFQPKSEAAPSGNGGDHDDPSPLPTAACELSTETQVKPTTTMTAAKAPDTNAAVDFRGYRRSNATHASVTDPEARLYKKSSGAGAILCFMGMP